MQRKEKAEYLGQITNAKPDKPYQYQVDPQKLRGPLLKGNFGRSFCTACGRYHEINTDILKRLAAITKWQPLPDITNKYIELKTCFICDDRPSGIEIKDIP